jgi:hypothetical protein
LRSEAAHTEVPRATLVSELERNSSLFSTQQLSAPEFFHDTVLAFAEGASQDIARGARRPARRSRLPS